MPSLFFLGEGVVMRCDGRIIKCFEILEKERGVWVKF
jgi:hypothetical protein